MTATAAVGFRATGRRRHQRSTRDPGSGIGKTCGDTVHQGVDAFATLPDGVGECDEVVLIGVGGKWTRVADQLPAAGSGDPTGMHDTKIPGMRLRHRREWSDDRCRVRIDEGQRRHGVVRAPWPAAATGSVHVRKIIVQRRRGPPDTRVGEARSPTVTISSVVQRNHRGSRRGRGMRGSLLPQTVPGWRSRAERFDMAVLEAYEPIERRWHHRVSGLDVAVDEIPRISPKDPDSVQWPPEVIADGPIALARLIPAGVDIRGNSTRARIVLFRKPIERRAKNTDELAELLHEVLVAQVATHLGVEPSVIDPSIDDE